MEHLDFWYPLLGDYKNLNKILEIGSYEGRSACWFLTNTLAINGELTCVDNWTASDTSYAKFIKNVSKCKTKEQSVKIIKKNSYDALCELNANNQSYDLIFIDGGHTALQCLSDIILSFNLLNKNGILVIDDYLLTGDRLNTPKLGIDIFNILYADRIKLLHSSYCMIYQKTA